MKTDHLIRRVQKIPEIESELYWYLETYKDLQGHPWEEYVNTIGLPLNIALPPDIKPDTKKLFVGLTVLVNQYELVQGSVPGTYRILVADKCLSKVKDPEYHVIVLFAELISRYYQAHINETMHLFKENLEEAVIKWNYHQFVVEEKVHAELKSGIEAILSVYSLPKDTIPRALNNYQGRIDDKTLENLRKFESKVNYLIDANKLDKQPASFIRFILEEISNGGENLNSVQDILPHYSNIHFN